MGGAKNASDAITVPKWKLVCLLNALLKDDDVDAKHKKSHKHKRPAVEGAQKSSGKAVESCTFQRPHALGWEKAPFHALSYMARVLNMAMQLSTTHRWDGNVKLFPALARQLSNCPIVIWKVGAQCLTNHPDGRDDLLRGFAQTMATVGTTAAPEILLDCATHLISIGEYFVPKNFLQAYIEKHRTKIPHDMRVVFQSYLGMIGYIEWFHMKKEADNDGDLPGNQLAAIATEAEIAARAFQAIECFNNFEDCQENVDGFMSIVVEMLEYYQRTDELEKLLQSYLQFNEIHPSPCVFMYEFLRKHHPTDVERQSYILEELARICPSHPYILDLCKIISDEEFIKSIQHLAALIDYEEWRNNLLVWQQMSHILTTSAINCKDKNQYYTLHELWTDRAIWWPVYHFRPEDINTNSQASAELAVFKSIVIATMFSSEHPYIIIVKEMLDVGKWENEKTYLIMKLENADLLNQQVNSKLTEKRRNQVVPQPAQNTTSTRPLQQQVMCLNQSQTISSLAAETSQNVPKQALEPHTQPIWKVAKKSKAVAEASQGRRKLNKIIIKKRKGTKLKQLNRRGRPYANEITILSSTTSSSSSDTTSSDEDVPPPHLSVTKGRKTTLPKKSPGVQNAQQPIAKRTTQAMVHNTSNGRVLRNPRVMPKGFSKPFLSSSDSDDESLCNQSQQSTEVHKEQPIVKMTVPAEVHNTANGTASNNSMPPGVSKPFISCSDSDDDPLGVLSQTNRESSNIVSEPARAAVPLKRKNSTASDQASQLGNKKSNPIQMPSNQAQNIGSSKSWSWRKLVATKLNQNLSQNVSDRRPSLTTGNVPAPAATQKKLAVSNAIATKVQAASNIQNVARKRKGSSKNARTSRRRISRKVNAPGNKAKSTSKTRIESTNNLQTKQLLQYDASEDVTDHSQGEINRPVKLEQISSTTMDSEETDEQVEQTSHILKWMGRSITLRAPVQLKNSSVVLSRI